MKRNALSLLFIVLAASLCGINDFTGEICIIKSEFIYMPGDVGFQSCHASTITEINGDLLVAWFGGTDEGNPDVGIWISHNTSGIWSNPVEAANGLRDDNKRYPCWNPVLYNTGKSILLFYKVGPSPSAWWGELITSDDNGYSWSNPHTLPADIYGPVKNKPLLLSDGVLICPSSSENDGWRVHMEFTSDNGLTWHRKQIKHVVIDPEEITPRPFINGEWPDGK